MQMIGLIIIALAAAVIPFVIAAWFEARKGKV